MDIKSRLIAVCLAVMLPTAAVADMVYQWHAFYDDVPGTASEVVVDSEGSIYMVGSKAQFTGAGGAPTTGAIEGTLPIHPYSGEEEMVVVKFDSAGNYQWHTYYGSDASLASEAFAFGIALDSQDNVYVAGVSSDNWLGDSDTSPLHAMGFAESVYVLKLNSDGDYQWHTFYGEYVGQTADIVVDSSDNVYMVGVDRSPFWSGVDTALHGSSGGDDLFVVKLDSDGAHQWHTFYGPATASGNASSSGNGVNSLAIDGDDNIFVAGSGESSWFGDIAQPPLNPFDDSSAPLPRQDIYVLKLDSEGDYQWHTFYGHPENDTVADIAVDSAGNVYITGDDETGAFDDVADPLRDHSGNLDNYILKLNNLGAYQWHTYYGSAGSGDTRGEGIEVSKGGGDSIFVLGASADSWLGDNGETPINAHADVGMFFTNQHILELGGDGAYRSHTFYPITGTAKRGITTDSDGNIYTLGRSIASWQGDGNADPVRAHSDIGNDFTILKLADSNAAAGSGGGGSNSGNDGSDGNDDAANDNDNGGGGGSSGSITVLDLLLMLCGYWSVLLFRKMARQKENIG